MKHWKFFMVVAGLSLVILVPPQAIFAEGHTPADRQKNDMHDHRQYNSSMDVKNMRKEKAKMQEQEREKEKIKNEEMNKNKTTR